MKAESFLDNLGLYAADGHVCMHIVLNYMYVLQFPHAVDMIEHLTLFLLV